MLPEFPLLDLDLVFLLGQTRQSIEPELFAVLDGIRRTGKLTLAAAEAGIPYRQAWGLLALWSERIGHPLVAKEQGRGTRLTPLGERLLWARARIAARLSPHLESAAAEFGQQLGAALRPAHDRISIQASHDLALAGLRDLLGRGGRARPDLRFIGSLDALAALAKERCHVAGFHLPDGALGRAMLQAYLPYLDPTTTRLVHFVRRRQGLVVAPDNPLGIAGVADIAARRARLINRQRGSGTHLALEHLLIESGTDPETIVGYDSEELTHLAVAAAVASGDADVGLCIETAARRLNMGFVPLFAETFYLLTTEAAARRDHVAALLEALGSEPFRALVAALPGYDAAAAGSEVALDALLAAA